MIGNIIAGIGQIAGGIIGSSAQERNARRNIQLQKDFAQQGIRWKVADAQAAGIHPIYALGAPTHSFSPVSIGDSLGQGISAAGQNLGRAVNSTSSPTERMTALSAAAGALQLERGGLENELLRTQIARMKQNENPALPDPAQRYGIPGQGPTAQPSPISEKTERSGWDPGRPVSESHAIPDVGWAKSDDNTWALVPGKDVKNRIEDMNLYEWQHTIRNQIVPMLSSGAMKGPYPAPTGERWVLNPVTGRAWLVPVHGAGKWATQGIRR